MQVEVTEKLQLALDYLVKDVRTTENLYPELLSSRNAHVRILTLLPAQAEALADRLAGRGEIEAAEAAYIRILNVFRAFQKLDIKAWHETRSLLKKLADMLWKNGDPIRAENLVWEALSSRDVPAKAQLSDLELLKSLARSISNTCLDISNSIQKSGDGAVCPPYCFSLFPPLQSMMQRSCASTVAGSPFHRGEFSETALAPNEPAILGGMDTVMEFLRAFPVDTLEVRDIHGQTPLYVASALGMEGLGRGILRRLEEVSRVCTQTHLNNRDSVGQTILGAAVIGRCSSQYIGFLLAGGAQVDPDPLLMFPWTPLQAAAMSGSSDVVRLLLDNKAQPDHVYPGNKTPLALAEDFGHADVVQQLRNARTGNARPTMQIGWNPG
jgi:ankyrin repeat protein